MQKVILGITAFNHDSSACVLADGKLIAFAEEERFNGQKHSSAFPSNAIQYCLQEAQLKADQVTDIAFYFSLKECEAAFFKANHPVKLLRDVELRRSNKIYYQALWLQSFRSKVKSIPKLVNARHATLHLIPHHDCHTYYAIYASGFQDGVVLSNDSIGEYVASRTSFFRRDHQGHVQVSALSSAYDTDSLGYIYGSITEHLGFKRGDGEGTVMGLSSYGQPDKKLNFLKDVTLLDTGQFQFSRNLVAVRSYAPNSCRLGQAMIHALGPRKSRSEAFDQRHFNIAYAIQSLTETVISHQVAHALRGQRRLVLTGGVAQNSVANGKIINAYPEVEVFVPPIPGDAGCSIGAAVKVHCNQLGHLPAHRETALLGPRYSNTDVIMMLENAKLAYSSIDNPSEVYASLLAQRKVVGRFHNRMECGPRALGFRSILASPIFPDMRDKLNSDVKFREWFRPYGCILRESDIHQYFEVTSVCPRLEYMSSVFKVKTEAEARIPSLVHVDKTCRVQTVMASDVVMYDLLHKLEEKTGVGVVINTSMNLRGKAIACTPQDALGTFYTSAIDCMIFNDSIMVTKDAR